MQALFAHEMNPSEDIVAGSKKLDEAINSCYTLFLYFFSFFPELKNYLNQKMDERKQKNFPTQEDLHPNTKFVDNQVIARIENNKALNLYWKERNILWNDHKELLANIYKEISSTDIFEKYMLNPKRSYKEDLDLLLYIVEKILAPSEMFHWFFEEKNVHWFDDFNDAMLMFYKNLAAFKENTENNKIMPLYGSKDTQEERNFHHDLYLKTLLHDKEYAEMIESKLQNWEMERVVQMDIILLKMAICELSEFSYIPIKVTINEYLELARWYSSQKSSSFINGILDRVITELREQGKLKKIGKGLING